MPFLIPIATTIASAIVAAITAVAAAIGPIITAVGVAVATIASIVVTVSTFVVQTIIVAFTWAGSWVVQQIGWLVNWITTHAIEVYTQFSQYVHSIYDTFTLILETIHFKTILQVHSIVYIVSPQYRNMMKSVYGAISNASQQLGLGATFLTLAIQNTRNLVLDVTGMFGQKYDLSQVSWLGTLNKYLTHFQTHASSYANNPEAVFWDLAELIERPAQDAKGAFQQGIISSLETALEFAATMGSQLAAIGIDVQTLITDLPQFIQDRIPDVNLSFWTNMSGWLNEWYLPTISALQSSVDGWQTDLNEAQARVSQLVEDLRRPGTMMARVDTLGTQERTTQEDLMAEITNRRLNRLLTSLSPVFDFAEEKLDAAVELVIPAPPSLPMLSYEPVSASIPAPGALVPRHSWFVGDY